MAWRAFSISGVNYTYTPIDSNIYTQLVNVPSDRYNNIGQIITDITWVEKTTLHDITLLSKDGYTIICNDVDGSGRELAIQFTKPNEEYATVGGARYLRGTTYVTFGFFIDDENEVATFAPYATNYDNATRWQTSEYTNRLINSNWLYTFLKAIESTESFIVGKGGGATHVAKVTGHLSALSNNLSDILVVAAGGGGSAVRIVNNVETDKAKGGHGGGYVGGNPFLNNTEIPNMGGNQSTGFGFGLGQDMSDTAAGGGGGLYGGYSVQQAGIIHSTIQAVRSLVESTFNESVSYSKVTT